MVQKAQIPVPQSRRTAAATHLQCDREYHHSKHQCPEGPVPKHLWGESLSDLLSTHSSCHISLSLQQTSRPSVDCSPEAWPALLTGPDPERLEVGSGPGKLSAGPHCSATRRKGTMPLGPEKHCSLTQMPSATLDSPWPDRRQDTEGDIVRKEMQGAGETRQ